MAKFNNVLVKKVKEDLAYEEDQKYLKKKHNIKNKNVVVVEKSSNIKFLINTLIGIIIAALLIVIGVLLFVAITALCYPEPRNALQIVYIRGIGELRSYCHDPRIVNFLNKVAEMLKHGLS